MNVDQAVAHSGVSRRTVYNWMQSGRLPFIRRGRSRFIAAADLAKATRREVTDMETEHEGAPETDIEAPPPPAPSAQGDGDSGDTTATDDAPPTTADDTRG